MLIRKIVILTIVLTLLVFGLSLSNKSIAANAALFRPGRIMDDAVFNRTNDISPTDIQGFLNFKVPTCDTWHAPGSGSQGALPPWTCLKNYNEGGKSAAQIIWEAGKFYDINPRVILATLQKETGLVTDTWPYPWQYRTAMGMGCPDGAPCDSQYYGFTNQVYQGTRHLRHFQLQNPNWTIPHRVGLNNIKWHPNTACGTSQVNIENGATSALYSYTPYRPNQIALNNLYSTGDGCSSYGNRNFWRDFTDWFGPTLTVEYDYEYVSASPSFITMQPDQPRIGNYITLRNTGSKTWYADGNVPVGEHPTRLRLRNYQNSPFADSSDPNWLGTQNQVRLATPTVAPGETGTFIFSMKGPYQYIIGYPNDFIPIVDGYTSMKDVGLRFLTSSEIPPYQGVSAVNPPAVILNNQKIGVSVTLRNTGVSPWYKDGFVPTGKKATRLLGNPISFNDPTDPRWLGTNNQIVMNETITNPGQNATFTFNLLAPFSYRDQIYKFRPILDGVVPMSDIGMQYRLISPLPILNYQGVSAVNPPAVMAPGSIANVNIRIRNTSNFTWRNEANKNGNSGSVRLIMSSPYYRSSKFYNATDNNWLTSAQIQMNSSIVEPGQDGLFTFSWKAPNTPGMYTEKFVPAVDGYGAMLDIGMQFTVTVQ